MRNEGIGELTFQMVSFLFSILIKKTIKDVFEEEKENEGKKTKLNIEIKKEKKEKNEK